MRSDFEALARECYIDSTGDGDDNCNIFSPAKNDADECLDLLHRHYATTRSTALISDKYNNSNNTRSASRNRPRTVSFTDMGVEVKLKSDCSKVNTALNTKGADVNDDEPDYDWFVHALRGHEYFDGMRSKLLRSRERRASRQISSFYSDREKEKYKKDILFAEESLTNFLVSRGRVKGAAGVSRRGSPPRSKGDADDNSDHSSEFTANFFERIRADSLGENTALSLLTFEETEVDGSKIMEESLANIYDDDDDDDDDDDQLPTSLKWQSQACALLRKEKSDIERRRKNRDGSLDLAIPYPKTKLAALFSCEDRTKNAKKVKIKDVMRKHKNDIVKIYSVVEKSHRLPVRPKWVSNMTLEEESKRRETDNILPYLNPLHDKFVGDIEEKMAKEMNRIHQKVDHRFPEASNSFSAERLEVERRKREKRLLQYSEEMLTHRMDSPPRYVPTPDWLKNPRGSGKGDDSWNEASDGEVEVLNEFDYGQLITRKNVLSRGLSSVSSTGHTQFGSDLIYSRAVTPHTTPPVECRYPGCKQCFQFAWNLTLHESRDHPDPQFTKQFIRKPRLPTGWKQAMREKNEMHRAESLFYS